MRTSKRCSPGSGGRAPSTDTKPSPPDAGRKSDTSMLVACARAATGRATAARSASARARRLGSTARKAATASSVQGVPPLEQPPRATPDSTVLKVLCAGSLTFWSPSIAAAETWCEPKGRAAEGSRLHFRSVRGRIDGGRRRSHVGDGHADGNGGKRDVPGGIGGGRAELVDPGGQL